MLTWDGKSQIASKTVTAKQTQPNWQTEGGNATMKIGGQDVSAVTADNTWTISANTTTSTVEIKPTNLTPTTPDSKKDNASGGADTQK